MSRQGDLAVAIEPSTCSHAKKLKARDVANQIRRGVAGTYRRNEADETFSDVADSGIPRQPRAMTRELSKLRGAVGQLQIILVGPEDRQHLPEPSNNGTDGLPEWHQSTIRMMP